MQSNSFIKSTLMFNVAYCHAGIHKSACTQTLATVGSTDTMNYSMALKSGDQCTLAPPTARKRGSGPQHPHNIAATVITCF